MTGGGRPIALPLRLFNTLSRTKEYVLPQGTTLAELRAGGHPADEPPILLYTCGPTVYDVVHLGNLRAFCCYDVLHRSLEWLGYRVRHVMNITDVDDKTIRESLAAGVSLRSFTDRYTALFREDMQALAMLEPDELPRATDAIDAMVGLVERLLQAGVAYRGEDGSVYFKIAAFPRYGALSRLDERTLRAGAGGRVAADEYDKDDVVDFALWKAWSQADGEVYWDTPLGRGRPGWHLECSALAMKHLAPSIDIHAGGVDLIFPHHENEIAQSEAASGVVFSRWWVHNEHLLVGGEKMSKSRGNFFTFRQLREVADASGRELRYALIADAHYRKQLNLQVSFAGEGAERRPIRFDAILKARESLRRLDDFRRSLRARGGTRTPSEGPELLARVAGEIRASIADDLNVPKAVGKLFELVREVNKLPDFGLEFAEQVDGLLDDLDRVFGFLAAEEVELADDERELFERWVAARAAKAWDRADELRDRLRERGLAVQARKGTATWKRI